MKIDEKDIPHKDGYKTIIHECSKCKYGRDMGKAYAKCPERISIKGWCHTYEDL